MESSDKSKATPVITSGEACSGGFAEPSARFGSESHDRQRFQESLRLQQAFAAVDAQQDRDQLLSFAERLADKRLADKSV